MRLPLVPTLIVGLAVAIMIGLGFWQLDRRDWKEALIAQFAANADRPPIAFPRYPVGEEYLYRTATAMCLEVVDWERTGGRGTDGTRGWRHIATCRTGGMEGPPLLVDAGVSADPTFEARWQGGELRGTITYAPDNRPLLANLFGEAPPRTLMLIAEDAAPGLVPSQPSDPADIPNNHLAYAIQWFFFAVIALVIYLLAVRRRDTKRAAAD